MLLIQPLTLRETSPIRVAYNLRVLIIVASSSRQLSVFLGEELGERRFVIVVHLHDRMKEDGLKSRKEPCKNYRLF
ncbi:MAG: hypothetical protein QW731_05010 [Thermofilaceae archaeon]